MAGQNYARGVPMGNNEVPFQNCPPAVKTVLSRISENATTSSVITMTANTTALEVATQGTSALIRWITVADTEASVFGNASVMNFDHVIPPNTMRRFVIPIEVNNPQGYGSMVGANIENGLFRRYAWRTQGVASVFSNEYGNANGNTY